MADAAPVDVLIVTLCAAERAAAIRRVVATTLAQDGVRARLIIVVNGRRYDQSLLDWLRHEPGVTVCYQETPSIFLARRCAREQVTAPYFGFLDDDDYLLDGALRVRVDALEADPSADAVVTNGYLTEGPSEQLTLPDIDGIRGDPVQSLLRENWLATASALFRTAAIPPSYFDVTLRSIDMTYVGFRLALEKKIAFVATPTFRKSYSADSISLTDDWALSSLATLEKMSRLSMPPDVRRSLRRKCTLTAHEISDIHRRHGELGLAWRFHLRSLIEPWGLWNYALYTRRLLFVRPGSGKRGAVDRHPAKAGARHPQPRASNAWWSRKTDDATRR
jgi:hypothetical protein